MINNSWFHIVEYFGTLFYRMVVSNLHSIFFMLKMSCSIERQTKLHFAYMDFSTTIDLVVNQRCQLREHHKLLAMYPWTVPNFQVINIYLKCYRLHRCQNKTYPAPTPIQWSCILFNLQENSLSPLNGKIPSTYK